MHKLWMLLMFAGVVAACGGGRLVPASGSRATDPAVQPPDLPDLGPAPELLNDVWLNTDGQILRLADLRGRVVLLEFWTFG